MSRPAGPAALRGDEERLYREHHRRLVRSVGWAVNADRALIDDACAFAWRQLLETQPERGERIYGWLRQVALREAWRLARRETREQRLEGLPGRVWEEELAAEIGLEEQVRAREALRALTRLHPHERRYMELRVAGYRYRELCERCGTTYTHVNRWVTRANRRLGRLAA
jgi:RNA polymerase sigma factor (sigma-70 family)